MMNDDRRVTVVIAMRRPAMIDRGGVTPRRY
jgi:hypothetical protein